MVLSQTLDHICLSTHSQKKQVQASWATFCRKGYFAQVLTGSRRLPAGGQTPRQLLVSRPSAIRWKHGPCGPSCCYDTIQHLCLDLRAEGGPPPAPTVAPRLTVSDSPPGARSLRTCFLHLPRPGTLPSLLPWQVSGNLAFYLFYIKETREVPGIESAPNGQEVTFTPFTPSGWGWSFPEPVSFRMWRSDGQDL